MACQGELQETRAVIRCRCFKVPPQRFPWRKGGEDGPRGPSPAAEGSSAWFTRCSVLPPPGLKTAGGALCSTRARSQCSGQSFLYQSTEKMEQTTLPRSVLHTVVFTSTPLLVESEARRQDFSCHKALSQIVCILLPFQIKIPLLHQSILPGAQNT